MKPIVVAFGGLGKVWNRGRFREAIERDLLVKLDCSWHVYDWDQVPDFRKFPNKIITVGHSFGGETAINMANSWPEKVIGLVTIDPRWNSRKILSSVDWLFGASDRNAFRITSKANATNFYQRKWPGLPGYTVENAVNLRLTGYSHLNLCAHPAVLEELQKAVNEG